MPLFQPPHGQYRPLLGMGCGVLAYLCYSMQDTLISVLTRIYPPLQVTFLDCFLALSLLLGFVVARKGLKALRLVYHTSQPVKHILRGTFFAVGSGLGFTGMAHVPLPNMYVIIFLSPLLGSALSGVFLKEPMGGRKFAALLLGFTGVVVALQPGAEGFNHYSLFILGAALLFSINAILNRFLAVRDHAAPLIAYPLTAVCVIMAAPALLLFKMVDLRHILPFVAMAVCLAAALFLSARAFRYAPIYLIAPCQLLQFLWGTLAQFFVYGNWPTRQALMGAVMIIVSNLLILYLQTRTPKADLLPREPA